MEKFINNGLFGPGFWGLGSRRGWHWDLARDFLQSCSWQEAEGQECMPERPGEQVECFCNKVTPMIMTLIHG